MKILPNPPNLINPNRLSPPKPKLKTYRQQKGSQNPLADLAQFSLNNVHKRGLKHHHFLLLTRIHIMYLTNYFKYKRLTLMKKFHLKINQCFQPEGNKLEQLLQVQEIDLDEEVPSQNKPMFSTRK